MTACSVCGKAGTFQSKTRIIPSLSAALLAAAMVLGGAPAQARRDQTEAASLGYQRISPAQLQPMLRRKDFTLINVHIPYAGEIPGTDAFIPYSQAGARVPRRLPDRRAKIVVYCQTGRMSAVAAEALARAGYTAVFDLAGGMVAWQQAGYPLATRTESNGKGRLKKS